MAQFRIGQKLSGKYQIEALLGVGGSAAVYAGRHRNGHRVAIKVLHSKAASGPAAQVRFLRESYLGNTLGHPGAVRVLDDDMTPDGAAYLVMELLQGASLRAIAAELPLDIAYVAAVGDAVLDVLEVAHKKGIVHRDIKPENLFLTDEGVLKLLDFGLARQIDDSGPLVTVTGAILGTPAFMAPEQVRGHKHHIGPASDLWSLGATLFTLTSGRYVHEGQTTGEVLVSVLTREPRPLSGVAPRCPDALCAVIDRALAREVGDRWPDASSMRRALRGAFERSFGRPLEPKVLLSRMAAELLPLLEGGGRRRDAAAADVASYDPTQSLNDASAPASDRPLNDASAPASDRPLGVGYGPAPTWPGDDEAALRERAPVGYGAAIEGLVRAGKQGDEPEAALFQVETKGSQSETLRSPSRRRWGAKQALSLVLASAALGLSAMTLQASRADAPKLCPALPAARAHDRGGAEVAYCQAFQLWQDGAWQQAQARFDAVTRHDPSFVEAHLYAVALAPVIAAPEREHFGAVRDSRQQLGPDEARLYEALEPLLRDETRAPETEKALEALAARREASPWVKLALGRHLLRVRHFDRAIAVAEGVREPAGRWLSGVARLNAGQLEGGLSELRRCAGDSSAPTDCLSALSEAEARAGRCEEAKRAADRLVQLDPKSPAGYRHQARAVMGLTHSTAATREALEKRWAREPAERRDEMRASGEFFLRVYDGEFDAGDESLSLWQRAVATSADDHRRLSSLIARLDLELELGRAGRAQEVARLIAAASAAWPPGEALEAGLESTRALYVTGQLGRDEMRRRRHAFIDAAPKGFFADPGARRFDAYARLVRDEADAREAVDNDTAQPPAADLAEWTPRIDAAFGRAYVLGGRPDKAEPLLRRAVSACWFGFPLYSIQARLWLGDALAARHDREGACRAYGEVLERWGRDARSVTAGEARARREALGCSP
ncbi:MAG TPA: protein kinase [Polyangiaceae bacterium]|nr:protein kinase [Polyangiaceae bacterium]